MIRQFVRYTPATIIAGLAAVAIPAMAARGLSLSEFAAYSLAVATCQFFLLVFLNWLLCAVIRFAPEWPTPIALPLPAVAGLAGSTLAAGCVYATMHVCVPGLRPTTLLLISLLTVAFGSAQTVQSVLRANEQSAAFTLSKTILAFVPLVGIALAMWSGDLSLPCILQYQIAGAVLATIVCFLIGRRLRPTQPHQAAMQPALFRRMLFYGLSISVTLLMDWLLNMSDRHLVRIFLGIEQTGLYSAPNTYADQLVIFPLGIIQLALSPYNSRLWYHAGARTAQSAYSRELNLVVTLVVPIALAVSVFSPAILVVLGSRAYLSASGVMCWVALADVLMAYQWVLQQPLVMLERWGTILRYYTIAALVKVLLSVLLIQAVGLEGPAIAKLVSYAVLTGLLWRATTSHGALWDVPWRLHLAVFLCGATVAIGVQAPSNVLSFLIAAPLMVFGLWAVLTVTLFRVHPRKAIRAVLRPAPWLTVLFSSKETEFPTRWRYKT